MAAPFAKDMKEAPKAKANFRFKAFLKEGTSAPLVEERYTGNPWVYFGADNLFLERMRNLADNSPLGRCAEMAAMFIAGKGIKFKDENGEEMPEAQAKFQEWMLDTTEEDFLAATALDIALANAKSWVVRRGFGGSVVRLDHLDVSRLRSGKLKDGKVEEYYWCSDWAKVGTRGQVADERYTPTPIAAFDTLKRKPKAVMYGKVYKQGRDHYSEPWYLPAEADCEVWAKVPKFNQVQIDTGFKAGVHLHTFFDGDPKDIEQYDEAVEDAYAGAGARGIFHTISSNGESVPTLQVLERGDHAGELDVIRDNAEKVIVRAYGIPDILYRMDTAGGLTSQGSALKAALEQFQTTFVEPKQQMICRDLVRLMNAEGIKVWEAEIEALEVFEEEGQTDQIKLRTMTINELRDEMDLPALEDDDERGDVIPGMFGNPMTDELEMVTPTTGQDPAAAPPMKKGAKPDPNADPSMDAPEDTPDPEVE